MNPPINSLPSRSRFLARHSNAVIAAIATVTAAMIGAYGVRLHERSRADDERDTLKASIATRDSEINGLRTQVHELNKLVGDLRREIERQPITNGKALAVRDDPPGSTSQTDSTGSTTPCSESLTSELIDVERAGWAALRSKDITYLAEHIADDVVVTFDGRRITKSEHLSNAQRRQDLTYLELELANVTCRRTATGIEFSAIATYKKANAASPTYVGRFTDVFRRTSDRWLLIKSTNTSLGD